ncbi:MAG: LysM peptidoglycan-binding domain-containing protein [Bacteroidota bacterium]
MKTVIKLLFALLLITQSITTVYSQNNGSIKKSNKQIFILGKKYYIHKVKRSQTLFSLSNTYKVSIEEIISENSALLSSGLQKGMEIKIPAVEDIPEQKTSSKDNFIYHTVQIGETLYFLTNKYLVSKQEIKKHNTEIEGDKIKVGQLLKIPKVNNESNISQGDYYFHKVKPSETLFSLAQQYRVKMESIERLNPEIINGVLILGQTLKIPKGNYSTMETLVIDHDNKEDIKYYEYDPLYFEEAGTIPCDEFQYNRFIKFKVALMLPLFINENNSASTTSSKYYGKTEKFYELYQGLLVAANKLKKSGVSLELYVYDTQRNLTKVQEILNKSELENMDLIIGPVYSKNFRLAANFAQHHKINIVSPVPQNYNDLVKTNPFIFMTNPSKDVKVANISKHLANSYDRSIIVIHNGTNEEKKTIELYKDRLVKTFASFENINEIVFKQVDYKTSGISGVVDALSVGLDNIVLIPSSDEAFITDIVTRLNYNKNRYKITIYGMKSWESFRNIQIEYLANLNCHYGTTSYIDYNNKSVKNFIYQYRNAFNSEPGPYSYLGYDITYYFLNVMKKYGKHFQFCLPADPSLKKNGLMYSFNFQRISPLSGFENNWLSIIKIDKNYKLIKVK